MKAEFRTEQVRGAWTVSVFYTTQEEQLGLFEQAGFEEPFPEPVYFAMTKWCADTFKTPKRAKRTSYTNFRFKEKRDLDWFILYWSSVDFELK